MFTVAALYHFTAFPDPQAVAAALRPVAEAGGVKGTLILAREGINGTVAGPRPGIDTLLAAIRALPGCATLAHKESHAPRAPFPRLKIRVKAEIVTMGQPQVDPLQGTGHYVAPRDWNALISAPDVAVIDTRNTYETAIGTFAHATDPQTASFRDFPAWWQANKHRFTGKRIAMFCTGGIRCEKSTNYLRGQGVQDVFHLQGGILKYLEEVPPEDSLWRGECFVFDARVSVGHGLAPGAFQTCHACRRPLSPEDLAHPDYEEGAACHHCLTEHSDADRARFRERHRQLALQKARAAR